MRMRSLLTLSVTLLALAGATHAQDKTKEAPMGGPSPAEMEAMTKSMTPGEQHKQLARMAGDWTFSQKFWMAPGQPPGESSGTMHADLLMDGRYVEHHWHGNFMGMPFEGRGTEAYDNVTKQYASTWIDNMGTGIMNSTGACEDAGRKCTYNGLGSDPMAGKQVPMRSVITWLDGDTFTNEMYGNDPSGKEMKMMEITAKRKK